MITNTKTISPLITSSEMESSVIGMDASGMDTASMFLRDKIYSDKIRAANREYTTNGLDEHVKFSISRPVEVSLIENTYKVRDFAKGLSEYDIRNVFGMYFRSTKTENNQQSGMFGLGSKAFFSYTDSFYIKSYFEGTATLYCATLAPGKNGIPVGTILKISEEETNETGLEVSCELKSPDDAASFAHYAKKMVRTCTLPILFNYNGEIFEPEQPLEETLLGDYSLRLSPGSTSMELSMGNVVYQEINEKEFAALKIPAVLKQGYTLHVSIPIGKMSLPISRESFETTPANTRELENLYSLLTKLAEEEAAPLKDLPFSKLVQTRDKWNQRGKFFDYSSRILYPGVYSAICNIDIAGAGELTKKDGKTLVAVIPNKKSADYWEEKLINHCDENQETFCYIPEKYIAETKDNQHLDRAKLDAEFIFKPVKNKIFNWKKKEKTEVEIGEPAPAEYTIRWKRDNGYGRNRYSVEKLNTTPLSWHEREVKSLKMEDAPPKTQIENFLKKFNHGGTRDELDSFLITFSTSTNAKGISITNKTGYQEFLDLGWYSETDERYISARKKIIERANKKQEEDNFKSSVRSSFSFLDDKFHSKMIKIGRKRRDKINKLSEMLSNIAKEKTLRGKIIHKMRSYYYGSGDPPIFSRHELRKVLKITA